MLPKRLPDLSAIDNATARRLLRTYSPMVKRIVALYRLDRIEGFAVGQDAVLEAFLSLDLRKAREDIWVRRVVHWRLAEAVSASPWDRSIESLDADPQILNGANPEEVYLRASAVAAIAQLPIRQQMIIDGRMRGESFPEIAESLGIHTQSAHRSGHTALRALRQLLEDEDSEASS